MYDEFAEEVVSMLVYARTQARLDFEYFSPFNETDCFPTEGPRIDPAEAPKVLDAVARRLKREGLGDVKLAVADQALITNDYIGPLLDDIDLMKQVGAFTLHAYGQDSVGPHAERIRKSKFPLTPVWLTEYGELNDLDRTAENEWKGFSLAANSRQSSSTALFARGRKGSRWTTGPAHSDGFRFPQRRRRFPGGGGGEGRRASAGYSRSTGRCRRARKLGPLRDHAPGGYSPLAGPAGENANHVRALVTDAQYASVGIERPSGLPEVFAPGQLPLIRQDLAWYEGQSQHLGRVLFKSQIGDLVGQIRNTRHHRGRTR